MDKTSVHKPLHQGQPKLERLFRIYQPRLLALARSYVYDTDAAKDIVQDMFLYLWTRRGTLHEESLPALLMTGVRNRCINYINRRGLVLRHIERQDGGALQRLAHIDMGADTERAVEWHDLLIQLDRFLDTVPPRQSEAFRLVRMEGFTLHEAAQHMEVSAAMACKLAHKAMDKVTAHFAALYPPGSPTDIL